MKIGIIGMGHLGKAVLTGLLRSGASPEEMTASARTEKTLEMIRAEYPGVGVTPDNLELVRNTDAVMIALRPGDAAGVLGELKDADLSGKTVISLMAGITIREIREMLQDDRCEYTVLRVMPNIGVSMCKGIIGVSSDRDGCEPEAVTELVNAVAARIRAEAPGIDIVFGLHSNSMKHEGAAEAIFADAREKNEPVCFGYLSQRERETLESLYPDRFEFERSDSTQDYIYFSDSLAYLAGKKYHSKRNHISKFYRTYDNAEVKSITPENIGDALTVVELWCEENGIDRKTYAEYSIISDALENLREFEMRGIILYVDQKPIAMTLGSEISPICFDVNFEKALTAYDGSYAVINNEFAKRLTSYTYINREEDLGLEGLRKSKLSYHPAIIYDRYDGVAKW